MESNFALRPSNNKSGTKGRKVSLKVNLYPISTSSKGGSGGGKIYHYDLNIIEQTEKEGMLKKKNRFNVAFNRRLFQELKEKLQQKVQMAYDGRSNIYTTGKLQFNGDGDGDGDEYHEVKVTVTNHNNVGGFNGGDFVLGLKLVRVLELDDLQKFITATSNVTGLSLPPMDCIAAMDVLGLMDCVDKFYTRGMNGLYSAQRSSYLGDGVCAWGGFYSSVRAVQCGLVLNVDLSHGSFIQSQPVLQLAAELWRIRDFQQTVMVQDQERKLLERRLKNLLVELTHFQQKRRVRVVGLSRLSAAQLRFTMTSANGNGGQSQEISVEEYYKQQYGIQLKYPNLPCIEAGAKKSLYPMELCVIVEGQQYNRKLSDTQTTAMIKLAALKPQERQARTEQYFQEARYTQNQAYKQLNLSVRAEMMRVEARILDAPELEYGSGKIVQPKGGAWNLRDLRLNKGAEVPREWAVMVVGSERDATRRHVEEFVSRFCQVADGMGMKFLEKRPLIVYATDRNMRQVVEDASRKVGGSLRFMLVMVRGSAETYAAVKKLSDKEIGFVSQCMLMKHVLRFNPQYGANILTKINAKLNGMNVALRQALPFMDVPTMLIGADVSHPMRQAGGGAGEVPSVVGMVGSLDRYLSKFTTVIATQPGNLEEITIMKDMTKELLRRFVQVVSKPPQRIVMFRDGVSEGQFAAVFAAEVKAIKNAYAEMFPQLQFALTFLIVQKRHHLRMFPDNCPTDRSGNVVPGVVVDTKIVHPREFDFYLMSHAGIQGTSRPVKYHVLYDEIGFSSDQMRKFALF